jgi:CRISPR-associated protein Csx14
MSDDPHVLIATLGGQPQIITFTLDQLLHRFPISEVIVVHPATRVQPRLHQSLVRLSAEFAGNRYPGTAHPVHFHTQALAYRGTPILDITDDIQADGTLNTLQQLIVDLKRRGYCVHLSVSGGRRMMALLAIAVAMFTFDRHDHIWHIYTPEDLTEQAKNGEIMHFPIDAGIKLIEGPFTPLGAYIPNPEQPFYRTRQAYQSQLEIQERDRCSEVEKLATPAQQNVLRAFASGLNPQQVADKLVIAIKTVDSHKTSLLNHCRNIWNIPEREYLSYHFFREKFARYFQDAE